MEMGTRVTILEERQANLENDVKDMKIQLNETAKRSDMQELKAALEARDNTYTRNLWRLVFALIAVFAALLLAAVGLGVSDVPVLF